MLALDANWFALTRLSTLFAVVIGAALVVLRRQRIRRPAPGTGVWARPSADAPSSMA
ncbi:hypothetical protein ACFWHT_06035 [Microbacterium sp. NPDC058342]|uniref:hypothetical protein n=1 Tax=Microbacterium sp. NPDC058342 TaxID=3346454 RepID=UPI003650C27B